MFQARPISLKSEVWDRIDAYLNDYAAQNPGFMPNRGAFIEEAVIAYLDMKEGGGSSDETTEDEDSFSLDEESSDDTSDDDAMDEDSFDEDESDEDDEDDDLDED